MRATAALLLSVWGCAPCPSPCPRSCQIEEKAARCAERERCCEDNGLPKLPGVCADAFTRCWAEVER